MNLKKMLALLLALTLICSATACGNKEEENDKSSSKSKQESRVDDEEDEEDNKRKDEEDEESVIEKTEKPAGNDSSLLIGAWLSEPDENGQRSVMSFFADGTLVVSTAGATIEGTFSALGDKLTMRIVGKTDSNTYTCDGETLSFTTGSGKERILKKQSDIPSPGLIMTNIIDNQLVGTWECNGELLIFNANGTGEANGSIGAFDLTHCLSGGKLLIHFGDSAGAMAGATAECNYEVNGSTLNMTLAGNMYIYQKQGSAQVPAVGNVNDATALIGTWVSDVFGGETIVFAADGICTTSAIPDTEMLYQVADGMLYLFSLDGVASVEFSYIVNDTKFVLTDADGKAATYTKQ